MSITSIGGTFFAVITICLLKPLLCTNHSLQLPLIASYDQYSNVLPFEDIDMDSDGVTNIFLTLRIPQSLINSMDFDLKRQFDPWGGKRHLKSLAKDEDIGRKRQFSPWGGKRSFRGNAHFKANNLIDACFQLDNREKSRNKREFNSWGGKRDANSWVDKKNSRIKYFKKSFNSWGDKRNFNSWGGKRNFNSWGGKRNFNSWGGKRNFNSWGGKRPEIDPNIGIDDSPIELKKNTNIGSKRQSFNAWGGKRSFNSWGGKRVFHSLNEKRVSDFESDSKELNSLDDNSSPYTYNSNIEEKERNMH